MHSQHRSAIYDGFVLEGPPGGALFARSLLREAENPRRWSLASTERPKMVARGAGQYESRRWFRARAAVARGHARAAVAHGGAIGRCAKPHVPLARLNIGRTLGQRQCAGSAPRGVAQSRVINSLASRHEALCVGVYIVRHVRFLRPAA